MAFARRIVATLRPSQTIFSTGNLFLSEKLQLSESSFLPLCRSLWTTASRSLESNQKCFVSPSDVKEGWSPYCSPTMEKAMQLQIQRGFAKRVKTSWGYPWVEIKVEEGVPVPSSQPNAGSLKNRKHLRRMQMRALFAKEEVTKKLAERKVAMEARDKARIERWRAAKKRVEDWKTFLASNSSTSSISS